VLGLRVDGVAAGTAPATSPDRSIGERSRRAVTSLRQVMVGARRSITGALFFSLLGAAALLVALPRAMAYLLAFACLWEGASAAWRYFSWRRRSDE
jgi:hypothetical protein